MFRRGFDRAALKGFIPAFNARHRQTSQAIYVVIALAMVMFGLWDVLEVGVSHPRLPEFLWTRFWMTFPVISLSLIASFSRRKDSRIDWHMTLVCLAAGICVIQMYYMFHSLGRQITIDGLIMFTVGVYFIPSMFPHQKLFIGMASMTAYFIFLSVTDRELHAFIHGAVYLGLLNVAGAIHSLSFDRSIKLNYLNNLALQKVAHTDQLTGVGNRYQFDEKVSELLGLAEEEKKNLFLAIVDIDDFKLFNDHYGHLEGDECLVSVSKAIREKTEGDNDYCIRFGGEEFILVKYGLPETELMTWCESVLQAVSNMKIRHEASSVSEYVTVSMGAIMRRPGSELQRAELMKKADEALYAAKSSGRNRVVLA